jgi:hypothetical protein
MLSRRRRFLFTLYSVIGLKYKLYIEKQKYVGRFVDLESTKNIISKLRAYMLSFFGKN